MDELNLNLLVAIVAKAMKEGFTVISYYDNRIIIHNKEDKYIELILLEKSNVISIISDGGRNEIENISEEDKLRFKLLIKDCEKYQKSKLIEDINNFFIVEEKEEAKKTINDLDSEDE